MARRIREFFRSEPVGVTLTVGVVLGLTLSSLLTTIFLEVVRPLIAETPLGDESSNFGGLRSLEFTIGNATVEYTTILAYIWTLFWLSMIAWYLFVRPVVDEDEDGFELRECPECKSSIFADATRCAFCTAAVIPIDLSAEAQ